jgi:hypothetical protein
MPPIPPVDQPTLADVYVGLEKLHVKVDILLIEKDRHDKRIRTLETWKAKVVGIALAASYLFSTLHK